jgi:hypothetical protein
MIGRSFRSDERGRLYTSKIKRIKEQTHLPAAPLYPSLFKNRRAESMYSIFYIIGVIVVIAIILSFLGIL